MAQVIQHLFKGRYSASSKNLKVGKKIFVLPLFDKEVRKAFFNFLKSSIRNPLRIFDKIYVQSINLQQPKEIFLGKTNLCDGCLNMMIHKGELINSCRLDEYRMYGGLIEPILDANLQDRYKEKVVGEKAY